MSIAVCVRSEDERSQLESFLVESRFPSRLNVTIVVDPSEHYPINHLRNVAIQGVHTSHFFLTDIDLWPASDLYETIKDLPKEILEIQNQAIVIPAYEVNYNSKQFRVLENTRVSNRRKDGVCLDLEKCWFRHLFLVPHHRMELMSCLKYGPCERFKEQQLTHTSTDYDRWESITNHSEYLFDVECFKNEGYEPYVVVKRDSSLHILIEHDLGFLHFTFI